MAEQGILISFSKAWGQDNHRWNYCGGDYNFKTMTYFMDFYGIKEAWEIGKNYYEADGQEIECTEYMGYATKNLNLVKKHYHIEQK